MATCGKGTDARWKRDDVEFPLVDRNGKYVKEDRSTIADRRLNNIAVEEVDCDAYIAAVIKSGNE